MFISVGSVTFLCSLQKLLALQQLNLYRRLEPAKNIRILLPNPLNIRIVSFQHRGLVGRTQELREGQRESVDGKVDRELLSVLDFLSLTC